MFSFYRFIRVISAVLRGSCLLVIVIACHCVLSMINKVIIIIIIIIIITVYRSKHRSFKL